MTGIDGQNGGSMKQRLADYVADFLVDHGIKDCFMVTGGGAMHLNDALGHKDGMHCLYNHHEQGCAIAAEAYSRIHNTMAALCVTTGPGGWSSSSSPMMLRRVVAVRFSMAFMGRSTP